MGDRSRNSTSEGNEVHLLTTTPLTYDQIAAKLGIGYPTVHNHTKTLYKQHNVHTRQALTLAVAPDTPLADLPPKHPTPKRNEVLRLHLAGLRRAQIAHQTGLSPNAVSHHLKRFRRDSRRLPCPTPAPTSPPLSV